MVPEPIKVNSVFKVITVCYHSRGKITTEVAFEFRSVVLEPRMRIRPCKDGVSPTYARFS